jgi:glutathione S-transferase
MLLLSLLHLVRARCHELAVELFHVCFRLLYGTCEGVVVCCPPAEHDPELLDRDYDDALRVACAMQSVKLLTPVPLRGLRSIGPVYATRTGTWTKGFAVLNYVAKHTRLYPKHPDAALAIDEWLEHHREFVLPMCVAANPARYGVSAVDAAWIEEVHIPTYLSKLEVHLQEREGAWIGGFDKRSLADVVWTATLHRVRAAHGPSLFASFPSVQAYMRDLAERTPSPPLPPASDDGCLVNPDVRAEERDAVDDVPASGVVSES